jgi:hypothetical protein
MIKEELMRLKEKDLIHELTNGANEMYDNSMVGIDESNWQT